METEAFDLGSEAGLPAWRMKLGIRRWKGEAS